MTKQPKKHLAFVDGLRALAAIFVVMHHSVTQYHYTTAWQRISLTPFLEGHIAVDLFIVLSGYSLMLSVTKNDYTLKGGNTSFFLRRIVRILPPYYFAMLVSLLLIRYAVGQKTGTHWDLALPVTPNAIVTHLLLIHDFFSSTAFKINHVFWSISVEFRIYLFFPFLVWVWKKYGPAGTLAGAAVISLTGLLLLLAIRTFYPDIELDSPGVSPYIILFTLGMLAADLSFAKGGVSALIRERYQQSRGKITALVLGLAGCAYFVLVLKGGTSVPSLQAKDILIGVLSALLLFVCSISTHPGKSAFGLVHVFSWRPLVWVGTFSYSLYLIHAPFVQILTQYVLAPLRCSDYAKCWLLFGLGVPLLIGVAYLFYYVFERPFLKYSKKVALRPEINPITIEPTVQ